MRASLSIGCGFLVLISSAALAQETSPGAANPFEGSYEIVAGEENGKELPEEHVKGSTVRITGDSIVVADKDEKELYVVKYVLDSTESPAKLTMTETGGPRGRKGAKAVGIIGKDGDALKLCYCYEGGIVPTKFKTKAGDKQLCFELKKKDTK
jgi:uncharacterized protein (TIGR03067 family)